MVGPGGEKIRFIERRSKCRIQHAKDDAELQRGFGTGPVLAGMPLPAQSGGTQDGEGPAAAAPRTTKLLLFGDAEAVEIARGLIMEAIDNREQKNKQRQKEYEKKRDVSCCEYLVCMGGDSGTRAELSPLLAWRVDDAAADGRGPGPLLQVSC